MPYHKYFNNILNLPALPEVVEPIKESVSEVVDVDPNSVVSNSISIGGTFTNTNAEVI